MKADDETNLTEIELLPNGRICVFGASIEVLQVLDLVQGGADRALSERLQSARRIADTKPSQVQAMMAEHSDVRKHE